MPRRRMIAPEFWIDEKVAELSRDARLLFIGLWNFADDAGNLIYNAKRIKVCIFPYDQDITEKETADWLEELKQQKMLQVYSVNGIDYLHIRNFLKYQQIQHPSKTYLPSFIESSMSPHIVLNEGSMSPHTQVKLSKVKISSPKSIKTKYGEAGNVFLTEEEYQKLIDRFGEEDTKRRIEELSLGISSKGYKYRSHYHAILAWALREGKGQKPKEKGEWKMR